MTHTLLHTPKLVTLDSQDRIFSPGYLVLEDNRIAELGPASRAPTRSFDRTVHLADRLVMPGLVNAHTHSPMVLFRGMAEGHSLFNFEGWYNTIRVVEEVMDPDMIPPARSADRRRRRRKCASGSRCP